MKNPLDGLNLEELNRNQHLVQQLNRFLQLYFRYIHRRLGFCFKENTSDMVEFIRIIEYLELKKESNYDILDI